MRRFLLVLTCFSFGGWSQPAQQPAQPPIVVKVEMPPESIWTALLKLAIPTILGAALGSGITLYGLRQTNKHNTIENAANRQHLLDVEIAKAEISAKHKSQDHRWEFRKDIHLNLITTLTESQRAVKQQVKAFREYNQATQVTPRNERTLGRIGREVRDAMDTLKAANSKFDIYSNLAPLAMADDVLLLLTAIEAALPPGQQVNLEQPDTIAAYEQKWNSAFTELMHRLQESARKDLWGTSEPEAKS